MRVETWVLPDVFDVNGWLRSYGGSLRLRSVRADETASCKKMDARATNWSKRRHDCDAEDGQSDRYEEKVICHVMTAAVESLNQDVS